MSLDSSMKKGGPSQESGLSNAPQYARERAASARGHSVAATAGGSGGGGGGDAAAARKKAFADGAAVNESNASRVASALRAAWDRLVDARRQAREADNGRSLLADLCSYTPEELAAMQAQAAVESAAVREQAQGDANAMRADAQAGSGVSAAPSSSFASSRGERASRYESLMNSAASAAPSAQQSAGLSK